MLNITQIKSILNCDDKYAKVVEKHMQELGFHFSSADQKTFDQMVITVDQLMKSNLIE